MAAGLSGPLTARIRGQDKPWPSRFPVSGTASGSSTRRCSGTAAHGKKGTYADLLITPLVDMFVIIVLFLIANFSATGEVLMMTKDIQLPEAVNVKEVEMDPVVMVSNDQVSVSGTIVGRVEDLVKDEYLNIPALEEKLRDMKKQYEDLHAMAE